MTDAGYYGTEPLVDSMKLPLTSCLSRFVSSVPSQPISYFKLLQKSKDRHHHGKISAAPLAFGLAHAQAGANSFGLCIGLMFFSSLVLWIRCVIQFVHASLYLDNNISDFHSCALFQPDFSKMKLLK